MPLREIVISSKNWKEFDKTKIYLTDNLYKIFSKRKIQGRPFLTELRRGRAIKALKHLVIVIKQKNKKNKIILTDKKTKIDNTDHYINQEDYWRHTRRIYAPYYRETGLIAAQGFLATNFPNKYKRPEEKLSQRVLEKVEDDWSFVFQEFTKKLKNKREAIRETSDMIRELREEKIKLKKEKEETEKEIEQLQKESRVFLYTERLREFKERLGKDLPETKGKNFWQKWIYDNNWLFGIHYQKPIQKEKVGFDSFPDYLFPTLDGFLDIIEIKRPKYKAIGRDQKHANSFVWSSDTNKSIGQVITYITEIELNQLQLKKRINQKYGEVYESKIYTIKPRAFILIGTSDNWKGAEREAFRKLNYSLHGIEVITYTDLYKKGEKIIKMYTD